MAEKIMQGIKQISELIGQAVKKRVVCLYRVSTVGQVEKDDIPMQKQYCREFCRGQSGWEIVKEFSEKGVSGFKVSAKDRDAIQEIQKMALKGEFDILLVSCLTAWAAGTMKRLLSWSGLSSRALKSGAPWKVSSVLTPMWINS